LGEYADAVVELYVAEEQMPWSGLSRHISSGSLKRKKLSARNFSPRLDFSSLSQMKNSYLFSREHLSVCSFCRFYIASCSLSDGKNKK
jgi:hypothetical protein